MKKQLPAHQKQTGATLIVALIFLVVLTIAGISAMQISTMEERMASNSQFRNETFQVAQSEIRAELQAFNASLSGRIPLLNASNEARYDNGTGAYPRRLTNTERLQLGLPITASRGVATTTPLPAPGFTIVRFSKPGLCSEATLEKFSCTDYELQTRAQMNNGAYSDQSQGIVFTNTKG